MSINGNGSGSLKSLFNRKNSEDQAEAVEEEILSIVEEGHEQGAILPDEAEMISNVFAFGDKEARDVMSPRQKISGIEANTDMQEALDFILENNYSRYPIYEDDLDNIIGVLHIKDAVAAYLSDAKQSVRNLAGEPFFIHPTRKISKLFNEMQANKLHMAIVVDEYGQTEGIVAMEDILEVLVGDILDEHDEEETDIKKLASEDGYIVKGSADLEELEELFSISFPEEDIDTVNGFMLYELGHIPEKNESIFIRYQGFSFEALETDERMIRKVCIRKDKTEEEKPQQE
ncbi:MAG: hemolysin family protein [Bacteroidales bacterium]|nr:hemolysin family protein [Clostridium sp.]MCM1203902.1 hemolysin family protein [Bacteroidales bacterium]